ncbi:hypothetical protein J4232_05920 [Candidatus Woesearchaeota archaeon]|nr:hypothetical protein [Candidatus Woesearchaeota archaeon]
MVQNESSSKYFLVIVAIVAVVAIVSLWMIGGNQTVRISDSPATESEAADLTGQAYKDFEKLPTKKIFKKTDMQIEKKETALITTDSCGPDFIFSTKPANDITMFGCKSNNCYVCSVKPELKAKAKCLAGFDSLLAQGKKGFTWALASYSCRSECAGVCTKQYKWNYDTINKESFAKCLNSCPSINEVANPCPKPFIFVSSGDFGSLPGYDYLCKLPSQKDLNVGSGEKICNKYNTKLVGGAFSDEGEFLCGN